MEDNNLFSYQNPLMSNYECEGQMDIFSWFGASDMDELKENEKLNDFIASIDLCNFISIEDKEEINPVCRCKGELVDSDIQIRYKDEEGLKIFAFNGRVCKDCERKYVIKEKLIEKYGELNGD